MPHGYKIDDGPELSCLQAESLVTQGRSAGSVTSASDQQNNSAETGIMKSCQLLFALLSRQDGGNQEPDQLCQCPQHAFDVFGLLDLDVSETFGMKHHGIRKSGI